MPGTITDESGGPSPGVVEFHVRGDAAYVHFEVPLPDGDVDEVLAELLRREAVEVVREKRHTLPIDGVTRVVAMGRSGGEWAEAASVSLETPGELPPPMKPELLSHAAHPGFDAFDRLADLPENAPGLASAAGTEELAAPGTELRFPASIEAGLRSQGIDPTSASAGDIALGVMRMTGYTVTETGPGTHSATRAGRRAFIRVIEHGAGEHPELDESSVDRFVVDFISSKADNGLLITGKYSPFAIYDRERRDARMRFITRERLQSFLDALALG